MRRSSYLRHGLCIVGFLGSLVLAACGDDDGAAPAPSDSSRGAAVAIPRIEGRASGGAGTLLASTTFDLAAVGYEAAEYFVSGEATTFTNLGDLGPDGAWETSRGTVHAPYKTRLVVYRPSQANRFNGTVFVEWLNVSGGLDAAAGWLMGHVQMIREGAAWIGVSAQYVGVEGGDPLLGISVSPLKTVDPARYGSLSHPGDSFSYDIFSQMAQTVRRPVPRELAPLAGMDVTSVIAIGESQSAFRLVTYVNAVHPHAAIYDGFLIHSRGGFGVSGAAPLSQAPQAEIAVPAAARLREDLDAPVLLFQTESDLTTLQSIPARQPDNPRFRLWEVAGTAHADTYTVLVGPGDIGNSPEVARLRLTTTAAPGLTCAAPINSGPQHYVLNAAIAALHRWVRDGVPPPNADRIEVNASNAIVRDEHGNGRGGVRTPQLDVPIATFLGEGRGSIVCLLFGRTVPFSAAKLQRLYPTQSDYLTAFDAATERAVAAGFLVRADADLIKAGARLEAVPGGNAG